MQWEPSLSLFTVWPMDALSPSSWIVWSLYCHIANAGPGCTLAHLSDALPPATCPPPLLCLAWPEAFVQDYISLLISFQYVSFVSCPCVGIWTKPYGNKPFAHFKRPTHPSPIPLFPVSEVISQVLLHSSFIYLVFSSESCYRAQAGRHLQRTEVAYVSHHNQS